MQQYQWFPGHMAKALKEIESKLKVIDVVIELVDARAPLASHNPALKDILQSKPTIVVLTKADLADEKVTKEWLDYYTSNGKIAIAIDSAKSDLKIIENKAKFLLKEKIEKDKKKGLKERPLRYLVVGIPNVGKSTLINKLAKRRVANVANRPGVTVAQQYIKVSSTMELLDTPGVLWPNFEDKSIGIKLAMIGTIRQAILPKEDLIVQILNFLSTKYLDQFNSFYKDNFAVINDEKDALLCLEKIANKRGYLLKGGLVDYTRTIESIIKDFQAAKIARISLETLGEDKWQTVNTKKA